MIFMAPIGYQTNLRVYGPGPRSLDFARVGGLLPVLL